MDPPKRFMAISDHGVRYELTPVPQYVDVSINDCVEQKCVSYNLVASDGRRVIGTSDPRAFTILSPLSIANNVTVRVPRGDPLPL